MPPLHWHNGEHWCQWWTLLGNLALIQQRAHWGIENKLHWTLDVVFREDACRARTEHAAENLAIMRHIAHQVLGQVKKAHHCGYVVAQNIPFGEAEPEGRPGVGVRHVVGRGAREGGLREGGRLTKARGRSRALAVGFAAPSAPTLRASLFGASAQRGKSGSHR